MTVQSLMPHWTHDSTCDTHNDIATNYLITCTCKHECTCTSTHTATCTVHVHTLPHVHQFLLHVKSETLQHVNIQCASYYYTCHINPLSTSLV